MSLMPFVSMGANLIAQEQDQDARSVLEGFSRANTKFMQDEQREFAKMGIQWRVQDAIAAGLHPLFALGANLPSFSPAPMNFSHDMGGGDMVRSAGAAFSQLAALSVASATVKKDEAMAAYYNALAAKTSQGLGAKPPVPDSVTVQDSLAGIEGVTPIQREHWESRGDFGRREIKASPTFSRDFESNSALAGSKPMWQSWQIRSSQGDKSMMMDIPWSDEGPMESLREMPIWMMPEFVRHNMRRYGGQWLTEFLTAYPNSPVMKWLLDTAGGVGSAVGEGRFLQP